MSVTAVIVQARISSSRLPGKVLLPLRGETVLWHVLTRCREMQGVDVVCCAVPDGHEQLPVVEEARRVGAVVCRGSETDVLARYWQAADQLGATEVMRITSDCPLIDSAVCSAVLALRRDCQADYASNVMPRSFPQGLDCEVFTRSTLDLACTHAARSYEREHVTPWIRDSNVLSHVNLECPIGDFSNHRWTLDHPEDFEFLNMIFEALPTTHTRDYRDILRAIAENPVLAAAMERARVRANPMKGDPVNV
jgi:spore coat polysaccharide biosynthesis protein SpsF